jgi:hypothetical protein
MFQPQRRASAQIAFLRQHGLPSFNGGRGSCLP